MAAMPTKTDVETIEGITRGIYEAISFTDPAAIDWARVRSHMAPEAQLIRVRPGSIERMTIDSWIEGRILWTRESEAARIPPEYLAPR
jgi:hypothetical protein